MCTCFFHLHAKRENWELIHWTVCSRVRVWRGCRGSWSLPSEQSLERGAQQRVSFGSTLLADKRLPVAERRRGLLEPCAEAQGLWGDVRLVTYSWCAVAARLPFFYESVSCALCLVLGACATTTTLRDAREEKMLVESWEGLGPSWARQTWQWLHVWWQWWQWQATAAPFHLSVSLSLSRTLALAICDSWFLTLDSWGRGLISWSPSPPLLRVRFPIPGSRARLSGFWVQVNKKWKNIFDTFFSFHFTTPHFWSKKSQSNK